MSILTLTGLLFLLVGCGPKPDGRIAKTTIIHGSDDRQNLTSQTAPIIHRHRQSVAMRVETSSLRPHRDNPELMSLKSVRSLNQRWFFHPDTQMSYPLCQQIKFGEEKSHGSCTGFLVAPNILLTAGHCVKDINDCRDFAWIFNYSTDIDPKAIPNENVQLCEEVLLTREFDDELILMDHALIKLKPNKKMRPHLTIDWSFQPELGHSVYLLGHPLGLPLKWQSNAQITGPNAYETHLTQQQIFHRSHFNLNLDTFSGNSGSPVFSAKSHKVIGIFVEGQNDFQLNHEDHCLKVKKLSNRPEVVEEKALHLKKLKLLQKLIRYYSIEN